MRTGKLGKKPVFLTSLIVLVLLGGSAGWLSYRFLTTPSSFPPHPVLIFVQKGSPLQTIARNLHAEGLITNARLFTLWARFRGEDRKIKSGEYLFTRPVSPLDLLQTLTTGDVVHRVVTIPEGLTVKQIATLLENKGLGTKDSFLCLNTDPVFLAHWGLPSNSLEGYLYPATYQFSLQDSAQDILGRMIARFYAGIDLRMYHRAAEIGMSLNEVITLASLIEKETGSAPERPLIASVFYNRLRKGLRLQCDPTVIYGLKNFDGNLTRQHLQTRTPYNTYVIQGLPPGPIANPGLDSIQAALYPAKSKHLYFVARGDGTHKFSTTLAEHNRAVRRFQLNKGYGTGIGG